MDRNCEVCKHHTEKGCCKWECQFEPKLSERDLHFRYLDGCADGLNEARKDTIRELEKVKAEIEKEMNTYENYPSQDGMVFTVIHACKRHIEIIDKKICKLKGEQE